jgi:hypothetical protein
MPAWVLIHGSRPSFVGQNGRCFWFLPESVPEELVKAVQIHAIVGKRGYFVSFRPVNR